MSRRDARCIAVALSEGRPLTVNDLRRAAVRVDDLLAQTGLSPRILECYLSGEKRPAGWVARTIAEAVGVEPGALWPNSDTRPQRGSFDDHDGRRAAQRNLGAGRSRGARSNANEGF